MQQTPKQASNSQPLYFMRYLSLAPVLAVVSISVAFTTWVMINTFFPDLLFYPQ